MENILVSIVIPVYNVEKYLNQCLESVINQTYSNLDIILIYQPSNDTSLQICKSFKKHDSRIRLFELNSYGLGLARNFGVEKSTGDFIMFLDSDDYLDVNCVRTIISEQTKDNCDLLIFGFEYLNEKTGHIGNRIDKFKEIPSIFNKYTFWEYLYCGAQGIRFWVNAIVAWNKLYKANIIKKVKFDPYLKNEDQFFIHKYIDLCEEIKYLNKSFHFYRVNRSDSITFNLKLNKVELSLNEVKFTYERFNFFKIKKYPKNILYMSAVYCIYNYFEYRKYKKSIKMFIKISYIYLKIFFIGIKRRETYSIFLNLYFKHIYFLIKKIIK